MNAKHREERQLEWVVHVHGHPCGWHGDGHRGTLPLGLFSDYAELVQRNFTRWRSLRDRRLHSGLLEAKAQTDDRRWRAAGSTGHPGTRRPTTSPASTRGLTIRTTRPSWIRGPGLLVERAHATTASCCRATASLVMQRTRRSRRTQPCSRLFRGEPRGFSETHATPFEPRLAPANALDDRTILLLARWVLPQPRDPERLHAARRQPALPASGHDRRTAAWMLRAGRRWAVRTCHSPSPVRTRCSAPDRRHRGRRACSVSSPSALWWTSPMSAARGLHRQQREQPQPVEPVPSRRTPAWNIAALRPYKGYGAIRPLRERWQFA